MKRQYLFYVVISLIFVVAVGVVVYGDILQDQTRIQAMNDTNTTMATSNDPTFIIVSPNETDNYPPNSMKVIQTKKVETTP